ncbi:hypothetical protein BMJ34_20440 [Sinorhizobium medicae]|uniref:Uncharacterized protein n=1 Tax=Sinorhizobium medicae TaxID=110321 RepID=A0A508WZA6_9HYPH|nr:hypothetical protein BMJ34_20440 [Sinorhizobium medicae]PLU52080.1 hypothetical protein BMJ25_02920 [Sinorhizobium medicae]VTZ62696.1 hypothetical protein EMEDMD4_440010 [Sinorhizobium medicae]
MPMGGKPIISAFHGYPWLIHRLTCPRLQGRRNDDHPFGHGGAQPSGSFTWSRTSLTGCRNWEPAPPISNRRSTNG